MELVESTYISPAYHRLHVSTEGLAVRGRFNFIRPEANGILRRNARRKKKIQHMRDAWCRHHLQEAIDRRHTVNQVLVLRGDDAEFLLEVGVVSELHLLVVEPAPRAVLS